LIQKILQYRLGIDPNEFLSQDSVEVIDIAGMNAKAVVDHRKMILAVVAVAAIPVWLRAI
jgi:hypothetical protein